MMEHKWREATMLSTANAERSVLADATAAQSHRMISKRAQELANERAAYQQAYDDIAKTAEAQQKLIVELQRIVDEQREEIELAPMNGQPENRNQQPATGKMVSTKFPTENDPLDLGGTNAQAIRETDNDGWNIGQTIDDNTINVVPSSQNMTDDIGSIGSSTDAGTDFLGEDASATVAALNNDLQSLDSEIASLQESLRRVQTGAAGATTDTAIIDDNNKTNPTSSAEETKQIESGVQLEQEILL